MNVRPKRVLQQLSTAAAISAFLTPSVHATSQLIGSYWGRYIQKRMQARWNATTLVQSVQLDYEKTPKLRAVRLTAPIARVGDPARVVVSGVEIEGRIVAVTESVLLVKVKASQLRAAPIKRVRRA